ncbi:hypothetical protein [Streptomyces sp. NPDC001502]|uniref:hypothetical protein n=1 Tax=Streptomyces sp. NPDC001502 TaxID=3364578 RepID=UPI003689C6FF
MRGFETGRTVVRRDVHRSGQVWSEQALRVVPGGDGRRLRNWYVTFEHPTRRTEDGFDTFDLTRWDWRATGDACPARGAAGARPEPAGHVTPTAPG